MTKPSPKITIRKTLLTLAAATFMVPGAAIAADAPTALTVKTTTNGYVKMSVKAFKKGEYARSIAYSNRALNDGLSKSRRAIVYNNLCAAHAAIDDMESAAQTCDMALELKPGFELAENNKTALTVLLAQK